MELIPLRSTTFGERMGQKVLSKTGEPKTRVDFLTKSVRRVHHASWADTLDQTSLVNVKMLTTKRDFTIKEFSRTGYPGMRVDLLALWWKVQGELIFGQIL